MNKNTYDQNSCKLFVEQYNIEQRLGTKYNTNLDRLSYDKCVIPRYVDYKSTTPRQMMVAPLISMAPFYYIQYLIYPGVDSVADIGCGMNFFKDVLPVDVHGIDGVGNYDEKRYFDHGFVTDRKNYYESFLSIDALHFIPLNDFKKRIMQCIEILKSGGRAFVSMNAARLVSNTDKLFLDKMFGTNISGEKFNQYIFQELQSLPVNFLVIDCLVDEIFDEYMDGNIRIVFEKD